MAAKSPAEMEASVKAELEGTVYAASSLQPLTGGTANFIFHVKLRNPLPDGTTDVVVKHGEGYVAQNPIFTLTVSRCVSLGNIKPNRLSVLTQGYRACAAN